MQLGTLDSLILETIARDVLKIQTLRTQNSDRLDFHEVSVGQVKRALEQAFASGFEAGKTAEKIRRE